MESARPPAGVTRGWSWNAKILHSSRLPDFRATTLWGTMNIRIFLLAGPQCHHAMGDHKHQDLSLGRPSVPPRYGRPRTSGSFSWPALRTNIIFCPKNLGVAGKWGGGGGGGGGGGNFKVYHSVVILLPLPPFHQTPSKDQGPYAWKRVLLPCR